MPIYAYKCDSCGHAKDVLQKMSDAVLTDCPACGASTFKKQLTAAGFQLKGSGWYVTDFKGGAAATGVASGDKSDSASDSAAASKTDTSADSGPATTKADSKIETKAAPPAEAKTTAKPDSKPNTKPAPSSTPTASS
jgi:putative FmdB family regulatory protein